MTEAGARNDDIDALATATCEVALTLPHTLFGVPRMLVAILFLVGALCIYSFDDWQTQAIIAATVVMVGGVVREAVSRDLWGFHNFCAWLATDFRFDTGGKDPWRGARLCALPTTARLMRGVVPSRSGDADAAR